MVSQEKIESPIEIDSAKEKVTVKGMQVVTEQQVWDALKNCYDPEIPINIVDLGLVYDVHVEGDRVRVAMTLTSPHCPLAGMLKDDVRRKLEQIDGLRQADVELVWQPAWTPDRILPEAKTELGIE